MTDLPYAADAEFPLSIEELSVLRRQYERENVDGEATTQTKFNYAWGLIKGRKATDQQFGVRLLTEIYNDIPERRRECLYYLALGNYKLGNYKDAKSYNDLLIDKEPKNLQAQSLRDLIEQKVKSEGMMGMMITGGIVAVGAIIIGSIFKGSSSKR
ncbi:mitochondrial fission 1 protein [Rhizophagus irregularis]|uniref:Mitochondrial fission 1 protein n=3 Tax=Rhizophagus irregularis TaxID=588596 RepID=A0A2I1GQZ9_9GLOM|nr:mitochondrial fission 1 protein [Rhizophagus irregularis DAOM 181602=DAOM 197198]EXX70511.1 Fis1p [Rhizophagus irregularis DAOM 197198w]PKC15313.1 mitochondrial fission 1 protein [Rhizophagus irregularis]PKC74602.1 mitochondrial fission 1 protein [Rhizophagus irregularis]PKY17987.1 mitochondrial fission 1 protein [Rhizophagus irregularis]PKY49083.1 mitochondrial fission 1 protein [Rhizophagus irregularis]|eukprot:XP_025178545.1 mitochondrial fission 1 protein [Rhizophagus irregularis DAOM 181602=DAOM 197198]